MLPSTRRPASSWCDEVGRRVAWWLGADTVTSMTAVFLHGAGRGGADGWPLQAAQHESNWVFLDRAPDGDDADRILDALRPGEPGHVVATSYGGNAAVLAVQRNPELVSSLALFEPACFDLARGKSAVEEHIAAMDPVYAVDRPTVRSRGRCRHRRVR
jgi:pimeloyl-ACP methyl ester carboxylesterase